MKKLIICTMALAFFSVSSYAQRDATAVKKATLLTAGTTIVNGKTGAVLRTTRGPIQINNLQITPLSLNPAKMGLTDDENPKAKPSPANGINKKNKN